MRRKPITQLTVQALFETISQQPPRNYDEKYLSLLTERELRELLKLGRLEAYYQPQLSLSTKKVKGLEVLARLFGPQGELIPPDRFIPTAENSTDLIVEITKHIIESALKSISKHFQHMKSLTFAFNISGKALEDEGFPKWLGLIADQYKVPHNQIVCELTETAISSDQTTMDAQMLRLRIMRFKLSIDDFGTGYSSIAKLHTIPFDELKIDKSFVFDCLSNTKSAAIVEQSIRLAKAMNIEVVAEGVENVEVETFLIRHGCKTGQGYLYAKPHDLDNILDFILTTNGDDDKKS